MNLFQINENFEVELNKEWIMMIPAFKAVIHADKGSPSDYDGRRKFLARKQFAYIYFMEDPRSPLFERELVEKKEEALRYAQLTPDDINTPVVRAAHEEYTRMCEKCSRSLITLKAVYQSLDQMDKYFREVDFSKVDKKGELLHDPSKFLVNIQRLGPAYDSVEKFKRRVMDDLKDTTGIRGTASLGYNEGKNRIKSVPLDEGKTGTPSSSANTEDIEIGGDNTFVGTAREKSSTSFKSMQRSFSNLVKGNDMANIDAEEEEDI